MKGIIKIYETSADVGFVNCIVMFTDRDESYFYDSEGILSGAFISYLRYADEHLYAQMLRGNGRLEYVRIENVPVIN